MGKSWHGILLCALKKIDMLPFPNTMIDFNDIPKKNILNNVTNTYTKSYLLNLDDTIYE